MALNAPQFFFARERQLAEEAYAVGIPNHGVLRIGDTLTIRPTATVKTGGMAQANADFDSMGPEDVVDQGNGVRTGRLAEGTEVVVRPKSQPTIEIKPEVGERYKIRYGND